jgi:hypothetical protein
MLSRETGHSRVPAPPHMMTGIMVAAMQTPAARSLRAGVLVQAEGKRIHACHVECPLNQLGWAKISTYREPTSHEVLALQRGANCRKSNLNVNISNDLAQVCANDAETPERREEIGCA